MGSFDIDCCYWRWNCIPRVATIYGVNKMFSTKKILFVPLLFLLFILTLSSSVYSVGLLDGLGSHWAFSEGSGNVTIDSHGSNQAVSYDDNTVNIDWDSNGIIGSSLHISGSNPVLLLPSLGGVTVCSSSANCLNGSISFWIKPDSYTAFGTIYQGSGSSGLKLINYQAGFITSLIEASGTPSYECVIQQNNPILVGEWNHIVVVSKDKNETEIWVNGIETSIVRQTSNTATSTDCITSGFDSLDIIGSQSTGGTTEFNWFNGSIDEFSFWQDIILSDSQILSLFNGGNSLSYASYSQEIPSLIQSFNDVSLNSNSQKILFLNDFFENYDTVSIAFTDSVNSENVVLSVNNANISQDIYNTDDIIVSLTSLGNLFDNDVRLIIKSNQTSYNFVMTVVAENSLGNVFDSFSVTILGTQSGAQTDNPRQVASLLSPITIPYSTIYDWDISDYFTNYDGVRINFNDLINVASIELETEKNQTYESYQNIAYNISLIPNGNKIILRLISNQTQTDIVNTLSVFYKVTPSTFNTISVPLSMKIRQFASVPTNPPTQIASIGQIKLDAGETHTFNFYDFMQDYTGASISFEDELNGLTANVISGQTYQQGNFTVQIVGEQVRITAVSASHEQDMFIIGTNQAGTLTIPFTLVIGDKDIGQSTSSGKGIFRGVVSSFSSLFPDSSSLDFGTRMMFVVVTILLTAILLLLLGMSADSSAIEPLMKYILPPLGFMEVIFFIAIGYVPISLVVIGVILAGSVFFLTVRGKA